MKTSNKKVLLLALLSTSVIVPSAQAGWKEFKDATFNKQTWTDAAASVKQNVSHPIAFVQKGKKEKAFAAVIAACVVAAGYKVGRKVYAKYQDKKIVKP